MATTEEIINQAISDFDDIEAAIEEMGVDVPEGTDTSEYANLIRSIAVGGTVDQEYNPESENAQSGKAVAGALNTLPVKYLESLESGNYLNLYDLDSGTYVLYGYFLVYPNATRRFTFSKKMLVSVSHGSVSTCVQVFYPPYNTIQYLNIYPPNEEAGTGYTYERKDAELYYMESTENKVTALDITATDEQYPSAKAVYDKVKDTSNALKANASGEVIRVDDVSPIEHKAKIGVRGNNLFDVSKVQTTGGATKINITEVGTTYIVITSESEYNSNGFCATGLTLSQLCPQLREGDTVTLHAESNSTMKCFYLDTPEIADSATKFWHFGNGRVVTTEMLNAIVCVYGLNAIQDGEIGVCTISNIQIKDSDTATEYEPYIDPTTVTVTRFRRNLLGFSNDFTLTADGVTIEYDADSQTFTLNGTYTLDGTNQQTVIFAGQMDIKPMVKTGTTVTFSIEKVGGTISAENAYNVVYLSTSNSANGNRANWLACVLPNSKNQNTKAATHNFINSIWFYLSRDVTFTNYKIRLQVEVNDTASDYEEYSSPTTYTPEADGTCEIVSASPTMTLLTDKEGANIEIEYNQDNNAFADNVKSDLKELDKVTAKLIEDMGDTETALDSIIAIQNTLIGGESE